jgi:integrase/recombinase XerD
MSTTLNRQWFRIAGTKTKTPHVKPTTNEALVGEYLSWKRSYSKSAHRAYSVWVKRFQTFTNKPPEFFRHTDYTAFAELLHANYAPRGVEFALNVVHNYLRYFAEQGRLTFPMYLVRVPKGASRSHPAFTENEYLQLTASMREIAPLPLRDLAIIMLLHDTGMRIGELLSLHISDIGSDKSAVIKTEKTVRLRRIFWNEDTDAILHDYLIERVNDGTDREPFRET